MKKHIIVLVIVFISSALTAQENTKKVKQVQKGDLIEATYFYADGSIEQQGTFNKEGKLHGLWISYDVKGKKIASGNYENGHKVGTWTFWSGESIKEVDFDKSRIAKVVEKNNQPL
ncbi:MAG: toxin-antitoxin system YwqK family antitoxin [Jejuia sp.]